MKVAMCICGEPLVSCMVFRKFEFFCVRDGRKYTFFGPEAAEETPELLKRMDENEALFDRLAEGVISDGGMKIDSCEICRDRHEPHAYHATEAEREADRQARARLAAVGAPA